MKSQTVRGILTSHTQKSEILMIKSTLAEYLQQDSKTLGQLLIKFNLLKMWNARLNDCLPKEEALLQHCQIVGLDKTSLIVIADNPHWVTRFRFFIPDLIIQLQRYEDFKHIRAICCKVRPPHYRANKSKRQPLVISHQTADVLKHAANKIKDKKLKEILMRMAERQSML